MDLDILYQILADVARQRPGGQITYGDLSRTYHASTGDWHEPHGSWDNPLGELNQRLNGLGWPALSAVVVVDDPRREPGSGFWGSSPNVPRRPANDLARIAEYGRILGDVHQSPWPATFPTVPRH
jgi:hypothetical protein